MKFSDNYLLTGTALPRNLFQSFETFESVTGDTRNMVVAVSFNVLNGTPNIDDVALFTAGTTFEIDFATLAYKDQVQALDDIKRIAADHLYRYADRMVEYDAAV